MQDYKKILPTWFWIIAIISVLWNIMGIISFMAHTFISDEVLKTLSVEEQSLYNDYPLWTSIIFIVAVLSGLLGSVALLARKKISLLIFQISLVAIVIQMTHNIFFTPSIAVFGLAQAITMPIIVIVYAVFLVWFSKYSIAKNWLR